MIPINVVRCFISELVDKAGLVTRLHFKVRAPECGRRTNNRMNDWANTIQSGGAGPQSQPIRAGIGFNLQCEIDFRLIWHRERHQKLRAAQLRPGKSRGKSGGQRVRWEWLVYGWAGGLVVYCWLLVVGCFMAMSMARARAISRLGADSASAQRSRSHRCHTRLSKCRALGSGLSVLRSPFWALSLTKWP